MNPMDAKFESETDTEAIAKVNNSMIKSFAILQIKIG